MKSPRRILLEKLVAHRPRHALLFSSGHLGVQAVQMRLPPGSPLYSPDGGEYLEIPTDGAIAPRVLDRGDWQPEEVAFVSAHAPPEESILLDIGANVGLFTRQLVHRLPSVAAAACFEPHPLNFRLLTRNLAHLPHCHPVQAALGTSDGEVRFYEDVGNCGNYSLTPDAMRGREYRTSVVRCIAADERNLLSALPPALRDRPVLWKSDTQGLDETIVTRMNDEFWQRVQAGVMEIWRIDKPAFDRDRLRAILAQFPVRRYGDDPERNVSVEEILAFSAGDDYEGRDLLFARR